MQNLPTWSTEHFFNYNSNNGGKTISININNTINYLTKKQFLRLTCTFSLSGSDRVYKITGNEVKTLI
jgi:hypothetical protein